MDKQPIYWEKTVEYLFVIKNYKKFQMIAPLDGNHEKQTADTVAQTGEKFVLIEFKRDDCSQDAEFEKFKKMKNSNITNEEIINRIEEIEGNTCHFIIYANLNTNNELELVYKSYVSYLKNNKDQINTDDYEKMIEEGIRKKEFIRYLKDFGALRIGNDDSSGNSSDGNQKSKKISADFSNVVILDNQGGCYTFDDFHHCLLKNTPDIASIPITSQATNYRRKP